MSLLFILFVFALPVEAHQPKDGDIHVSTGPYITHNHVSDHSFETSTRGGWSLLAEGDIDNNGGAEIGAQYIRQLYSVQKDGLVLDETCKRMYITMGYRHWFSPAISMAGAFFSAYAMGDPQTVRNDFGNNNRPNTSAKDPVEYGFDFSVQVEPFRWGRWAIVTDLRYSLSVTSKPGESSNFLGAMINVKYFAQSKESAPE